MMGTVRRVSRNVKRWRNAVMALRWTAAGMLEATKGFRRLKAHKYLPVLSRIGSSIAYFNKIWGIPTGVRLRRLPPDSGERDQPPAPAVDRIAPRQSGIRSPR